MTTTRFLRGRGFFVMTQVLICLCLTALALVGPLHLVLTEWALTSQEIEVSPNRKNVALCGLLNAPCRDDAHFFSPGNEAFAEMTITGLRFLNHGKVENGHLSASLDFATSAPRQSALSRERQRLSVSTLILWPTSETG